MNTKIRSDLVEHLATLNCSIDDFKTLADREKSVYRNEEITAEVINLKRSVYKLMDTLSHTNTQEK